MNKLIKIEAFNQLKMNKRRKFSIFEKQTCLSDLVTIYWRYMTHTWSESALHFSNIATRNSSPIFLYWPEKGRGVPNTNIESLASQWEKSSSSTYTHDVYSRIHITGSTCLLSLKWLNKSRSKILILLTLSLHYLLLI